MVQRSRRGHADVDADAASTRGLPDAAQILDALRNALDVRLPPRRQESTRKYLAGGRVLGEGVLRALIDAVVAAGYLSPIENDAEIEGVIKVLSDGLSIAIAHWDQLVGHTRALSAEVEFKTTATRYLRLAAIDIAIRSAALDVFARLPPVPAAIDVENAVLPVWAREGGVQRVIRALPNRLAVKRSVLSVGKQFDDLFQGRHRPSSTTIGAFARVVAEHDKAKLPAMTWGFHLLWTFALDNLCNEIAAYLGRSVAEEVASAFRRIRSSARRVLADVWARTDDGHQAASLFATLIVEGARSTWAGRLIDHVVRDEAEWAQSMHVLSLSEPNRVTPAHSERDLSQRFAWVTDIRACHAHWILSEFAQLVSREPLATDDIPDDLLIRLGRSLANVDADPHEFVDACMSHPAAFLWASRLLVQRAFVTGEFESVIPMIAKFADAVDAADLYFEAAVIHAVAGRLDDTLRYVEAIGNKEPFASAARPLAAIALVFTGRHADGLQQLDALDTREGAVEYSRGVALRGLGHIAEALAIFETIIAETPGHAHAPALEQAAHCCYALAKSATGPARSKWTTKANRYAKHAERLGRSLPREKERPRRRAAGPPNGRT